MVRIPLDTLPGAGSIMMVNVTISSGGMKKEIPALIDTGAPITILDPTIAKELDIKVISSMLEFKIRGVEDVALEVLPSEDLIPMTIVSSSSSSTASTIYDFGQHRIFIGRLPGLEAIQQIFGSDKEGQEHPVPQTPLMTLGLDWLTQCSYRMLLRASKKECWFEPLKNQPRWNGEQQQKQS
jgi:hypothetical protein